MNSFETFLQLHRNENPLLIGNAWDVYSARVFERNGFKAIATSSAALARSLGYEDGENIPFDLLLQTVKKIISNINIPLSVDMEKGYSNDIPGILENIERLHDLGVVGFNIEDSSRTENKQLQPVGDFQKIISSIMDHLDRKNIKMYLNARIDVFLLKLPSPMPEIIKRTKAYESAGASGIFIPGLADKDEIRKVVETTKLPVNVFPMKELPGFKELTELGVKRISMGSAIHNSVMRSFEKTIVAIQQDQSFKSFY